MRKKRERKSNTPETLIGLEDAHLLKVDEHLYAVREAWEALSEMKRDAERDGVILRVVSAFRSFDRQKEIWNSKVKSYILKSYPEREAVYEVLRFTAFPGTSRHHWGTDFDIAGEEDTPDPLKNEHFMEGGIYHETYKWLSKNGEKFGFYQVYILDTQYPSPEMWHWSYAPIAREMLKLYIEEVKPSMLKGRGVIGEEIILSDWDKYIADYLLSINPVLKP